MPTRYLKPGIRDSEKIDSISFPAESLFYRLLVTVDDFGRFDGRPKMVKAACFPIKDSMSIEKTEELMIELIRFDLIFVYEINKKPYLQVNTWDNKPRAKESKYPEKTDECIQVYTDVKHLHTYVPLTETETETETGTETERDKSLLSQKRKIKDPIPEDIETATYIWLHVSTLAPNQREPNIQSWANTIRLMRERDKRSDEEIRSVFFWAHNDSFWRANILSPEKLRKQFNALNAKRLNENNQRTSQNSGIQNQNYIDHTSTNWDIAES